MSKTAEELADEYTINVYDCLDDSLAKIKTMRVSKHAFLAGYQAAQKQATENSASITLKDILRMTIEEYLFKHSEEIAEEVLNNNPLLKELKDEQDG